MKTEWKKTIDYFYWKYSKIFFSVQTEILEAYNIIRVVKNSRMKIKDKLIKIANFSASLKNIWQLLI